MTQAPDNTFPGLSSIFQHAPKFDVGRSPSFLNGTLQNVYRLQCAIPFSQRIAKPNQPLQRKSAQVSSTELVPRRSETRADIIKVLGKEVNELNQRLQEKTGELLRVEGFTNRQKAEMGKLNKLLQKKEAEYTNLEEDANLQNRRHEKTIMILKAQVYGMILADMDQKEKYEKEIQGLQTKSSDLVKDMNQLRAKHEEEIQGLQTQVSDLVEDMNQLKTKHKEEIRGLQAKICKHLTNDVQYYIDEEENDDSDSDRYEHASHNDDAHDYQTVQEEDDTEYTRLRELAQEEWKKRKACTEASRAAFALRDGARAKELSIEGKDHDRLMKQYNKKAADLIFRLKNAHLPPTKIDLHGLFVKEASERVKNAIQKCQQMQFDHLEIIVGQGLHSPGQIAKLKPAIARILKQYQVTVEPDQPNQGCLLVKFGQSASNSS